MNIASIVFLTIGFLALLEGLAILLFPDWLKKVGKYLIKNTKKLRKISIIEIIVAIIFIIIGIILGKY